METLVSPVLIVSAIITTASAICAAIMTFYNARKLDAIHQQYNSRMDQLLAATGLAKFAEGEQFERDKAKQ